MRLHSCVQELDFNDFRSQILAVLDGIDFLQILV